MTINFGSGTVQHDAGSDTVHSLTTTNPFELAGGTLSVVTATQVNNAFTLSGGTLSGRTVGSTVVTRREKECRRNFSLSAFPPDTLLVSR